ncbi:helix-turn-helix transcriptional regulator [Sessilibacter sp. MAH2]
MNKLQKIQRIHQLFKTRRRWLSASDISSDLKAPESEVSELLAQMQSFLSAPIEFSEQEQGYRYREGAIANYNLPDFWLSASEIVSLSRLHNNFNGLSRGLLSDEVEGFKSPIEQALRVRKINSDQFYARVKYIPNVQARTFDEVFSIICAGVLERRQIAMHYNNSDGSVSHCTVCPQLLVHRENVWILEAWCHMHRGLRSFNLSRVGNAEVLKSRSREIAQKNLDKYFDNLYGVNQQRPQLVELKFSGDAAYEAASQLWHVDQNGFWQDGHYCLHLPLQNEDALIKRLLPLLPNVQVLQPQALKMRLHSTLTQALKRLEELTGDSVTLPKTDEARSSGEVVHQLNPNGKRSKSFQKTLKQA